MQLLIIKEIFILGALSKFIIYYLIEFLVKRIV